jgi:hypothetical protein
MRSKTIVLLLLAALLAPLAAAGCSSGPTVPVAEAGGTNMVAKSWGRYFQVYDGTWKGMLVKGVDIGASMPGHYFGELSITKSQYLRWMDEISAMKANTILVYTLLKPDFYKALLQYNKAHPDRRLWLIQEFWPSDQGVGNNLYLESFVSGYQKEMILDTSAVLGKANIGERRGLAWGKYTANVMPYVLGIVVGRELTMEEVRETDQRNGSITGFQGGFVRTSQVATPTETWCARMADMAAARFKTLGWSVPVGFVSWPTLDPLVHPTEGTPDKPKYNEADDSRVLDPRHLAPGPSSVAGFFGMYQVYPYYPEFMYREPAYASYTDSQGVLRYGGYLKDFMKIHPDYPAIIGEYGLPTSVSNAHQQPEGLSQGGIDEDQQGIQLSRMFRAIVREGYAGGLLFEWSDEWAKKNWTVMPYMVPFDRHILWHNITDPEQCFGLLSYEDATSPPAGLHGVWKNPEPGGSGRISAAYARADASCLYLGFETEDASALLPEKKSNLALYVGISTLGRGHGTVNLPVNGVPSLPTGVEFLLKVSSAESLLLNVPDYSRASSKFWAAPSRDPSFEHIIYITNRAQQASDGTILPAIYYDQSVLKYGDFSRGNSQFDSLGNWFVDPVKKMVVVRLPWTIVNVSDPSSNQVIFDLVKDLPPGPAGLRVMQNDYLDTMKTPGFQFFAALTDGADLKDIGPRGNGTSSFLTSAKVFNWRGWESPSYVERLKSSYRFLQATYGSFSGGVPPTPQP